MNLALPRCLHLFSGVADKLSHIQQCQARASSVQDVLELLAGSRASSSSSSGSSTAAASAAASAANSSAAAVALRGCLGTVKALVKAMETSKKDTFQAWQVRWDCLTQKDTSVELQDMVSAEASLRALFKLVFSRMQPVLDACSLHPLVGICKSRRFLASVTAHTSPASQQPSGCWAIKVLIVLSCLFLFLVPPAG